MQTTFKPEYRNYSGAKERGRQALVPSRAILEKLFSAGIHFLEQPPKHSQEKTLHPLPSCYFLRITWPGDRFKTSSKRCTKGSMGSRYPGRMYFHQAGSRGQEHFQSILTMLPTGTFSTHTFLDLGGHNHTRPSSKIKTCQLRNSYSTLSIMTCHWSLK